MVNTLKIIGKYYKINYLCTNNLLKINKYLNNYNVPDDTF